MRYAKRGLPCAPSPASRQRNGLKPKAQRCISSQRASYSGSRAAPHSGAVTERYSKSSNTSVATPKNSATGPGSA
eukprot:scaffold475_cov279-Pinguiococcus_pyrenoidosus.AAC.7